MPLITLCGFPCVGKTTFASQLATHIEHSLQKSCVIVNEEALHINKPNHYKSATQEKILRQNLKSAVEHALNADTIVIFDSCNYIKGYRYELYCIARSQRTPHCVVQVSVDNVIANEWNQDNCEELTYDRTLLEDLRRRFEAPNESNRWDKPLFQVNMGASTKLECPLSPSESSVPEVSAHEGACGEFARRPQEKVHTGELREEEGAGAGGTQVDVVSVIDPVPSPGPDIPVAVFSSWKSSKGNTKQGDDTSLSTHKSSPSSSFIKKPPASSNVFFSGNRAVEVTGALTKEGSDESARRICAYLLTAEAPPPSSATNTVRHSSANLLYQIDKVSQTITQSIVSHQQKYSVDSPLVFREHGGFSLKLSRRMSMAELQRHRRQYLKVSSQHPPEVVEDVGRHYLEFLENQC